MYLKHSMEGINFMSEDFDDEELEDDSSPYDCESCGGSGYDSMDGGQCEDCYGTGDSREGE